MDTSHVAGLSDADFGDLFIACCKRIQAAGGIIKPAEAYYEMNRTVARVFFEIICIREVSEGRWEWLLEQRPADDPYFASQWCCQGATVLVRESLEAVARRHAERECGIHLDMGIRDLEFAGVAHLPHTEREHALSVIFVRLVKPTDEGQGHWLPIKNDLPEPFVDSMRGAMRVAKYYIQTGKPTWNEYLGQ